MREVYRAANVSLQHRRCAKYTASCSSAAFFTLGVELEPVLHVIPAIRLSSTSGSGSGQFIRSRRTLASRREGRSQYRYVLDCSMRVDGRRRRSGAKLPTWEPGHWSGRCPSKLCSAPTRVGLPILIVLC